MIKIKKVIHRRHITDIEKIKNTSSRGVLGTATDNSTILMDEMNAHYVEALLSDPQILEMLLTKKPTVKEKIAKRKPSPLCVSLWIETAKGK